MSRIEAGDRDAGRGRRWQPDHAGQAGSADISLGAEEMGVPPDECLVFEDAVSGIEAAKAAGMLAIGVGTRDILGGADLVIKDLAEFDFKLLELTL